MFTPIRKITFTIFCLLTNSNIYLPPLIALPNYFNLTITKSKIMKQKLMLCLLMAGGFYLTTNAQIKKGKWIGGLSLAGENKRTITPNLGGQDSKYKENFINANLVFNKMISNKFMLGIGFNFNTFMKSTYSSSPSVGINNRYLEETYGPVLQAGYFKEFAKNLYVTSIFQMRYNYYALKRRDNYNLSNEVRNKSDGREIAFGITPVQLNYIFKNKYMLGFNLITLNYYNIKTSASLIQNNGTMESFSYSLNPFRNGISFSYIF
jgi:hypothetical protein